MNIKNNAKLYYPLFDALRCFALIGVLIEHWVKPYFTGSYFVKIPFGGGVNLFFVLGAFLMASGLVKQLENKNQTTFWQFYKKVISNRILRIFPLYYLFFGILWYLKVNIIRDCFGCVAFHVVNLCIAHQGKWMDAYTHLWSLGVELQFYFLIPIVLWLVPLKHQVKLYVGLILFSLVFRFLIFETYKNGIVNVVLTPSAFAAFGMGGLMGLLSKTSAETFDKYSKFLFKIHPVVLVGYAICCIYPKPSIMGYFSGIYGDVWFALLATTWVCWCYKNSANASNYPLLNNPIVSYLGQISFGFYLIHLPIPELYVWNWGFSKPDNAFVAFGIYFSITILLASISYRYFESYFIKLKFK